MHRVLVLDGHSSAALAFVRSLGRAGYWVEVGFSQGSFAPAALSRYCKQRFEYPNPISEVKKFLECVLGFVQEQRIGLIAPMTDATMGPISRHRGEFQTHIYLAMASHNSLEMVSDKYKTILLARELGIPVPETILVHSINDLEYVSGWKFPIVVKDRFSIRWTDGSGIPGFTSYAYSRQDLLEIVKQRLGKSGDVLLQKYIVGVGIGFSCFSLSGDIYIPFQWERIREKDPRGSGSSARKSTDLDQKVMEFGKKLMVQTGFHGISMVEFKKDKLTRQLTLMEINGRPWGSLQLPIHCGIDYPLHFISWCLEGKLPPKEVEYRKKITCRWLTADLGHLENLWEGKPSGWPIDYPNFWVNLLNISIPWYPGLRYDDMSLSDPKPGIAGLVRWFRSHIKSKSL